MVIRRVIPIAIVLSTGLVFSTPASALNYGAFDLGTLGGSWSIARGINASGQVVGSSGTADYPDGHAFITGANGVGITDLNSLVMGRNFYEASAINDLGQIVTRGGNGRAFLISMIPEPETLPLMLVGLGLVGVYIGRKNRPPVSHRSFGKSNSQTGQCDCRLVPH